MKKALVYRWKAYNQMDVELSLLQAGVELQFTDFVCSSIDEDEAFVQRLVRRIREDDFDFVFSVNYFTVISNACDLAGIRYVSWLCDSRLLTMHNKSVFHPCNAIFVFDRVDYAEFRQLGANVFYLPLAVNTDRLDALIAGEGAPADSNSPGLTGACPGDGTASGRCVGACYQAEIAFVGSMYAGKNEYDKCRGELTPYLQGYFDAALRAQMDVYGEDVIAQLLTPDILVKLAQTLRFEKARDSFSTLPLAFSVTHLGFKLANLERMELLGRLGRSHQVALYSDVDPEVLPQVEHRGRIDYWKEMPIAFHESRINLNITMRNIRTGLPLRVFDILGSGGFLLTNYQAEIPAFFEPGKELAVYESFSDCEKKAEYYLTHEDERCSIAENGYRKVKQFHTYEVRISQLLRVVDEMGSPNN